MALLFVFPAQATHLSPQWQQEFIELHIMSNVSYYTAEGLQKLKDEIHQMKTVERPKISQQIAEARDKGDLSENAEYDAAKEAQGMLEAKIAKMENLLANARVIDDSDIDNSKVFILGKVRIKNQKTGAEVTYTLVAENEANLAEKNFSRQPHWKRASWQSRW